MNRRDRRLWREALTLAHIGELTARWCEFGLQQTPGHLGPPDLETYPYLSILAGLNRHGPMITTNSQAADVREHMGDVTAWNAWVQGISSPGMWRRTERRCLLAGLRVQEVPRRVADDECSFYADRCPLARAELKAAVYVMVYDPEPGRNDRLWPALAALAAPVGEEHTP